MLSEGEVNVRALKFSQDQVQKIFLNEKITNINLVNSNDTEL
jgi:hypothetical protein